jgi:hypothetical protein
MRRSSLGRGAQATVFTGAYQRQAPDRQTKDCLPWDLVRPQVFAVGDPAARACSEKADFFDQNMLQLFESERFLFDQMIPSDRDAL